MAKYKWLILMPILAFALVFGPNLIGGSKSNTESRSTTSAIWKRSSEPGSSKAASPGLGIDATSMAMSLFGVLVLACGAIWLLKKLQTGGRVIGGREILIKETHRLNAKRAIHLARVSDRLLLLGDSEAGIQLLKDLTPPEETEPLADATTFTIPRPEIASSTDEEGAVPRDYVIQAAKRQTQPKDSAEELGNFRELLHRLGKA